MLKRKKINLKKKMVLLRKRKRALMGTGELLAYHWAGKISPYRFNIRKVTLSEEDLP